MPSASRISFLLAFADGIDYFLVVMGTIGAAVHGFALPIFLLVFGKFLNTFGSDQQDMYQNICKNALYLVYLAITMLFSSWTEVACWMQAGERLVGRIRLAYLDAVLKQEVRFFDVEARTGEVINTIATETTYIQEALSEKVGNFMHFVCTFIGGFIVGFGTVWQEGLVTLAIVPLIVMVGGFYTYGLTRLSAQAQTAYTEAGNVAEEVISQIRTVYAFTGEENARRSYSEALGPALKIGIRSACVKGAGVGFMYGTFSVWALLLWYGGVLVRHGKASGGSVLSTILAVLVGGLSLGQASANLAIFGKAAAAISKIMETASQVPEMDQDDEHALRLEHVEGRIELKEVHFSYPSRPDVRVLKGLSLIIPAGKSTAVVGTSGCGKSTLVSLIERFYDPSSGQVLLDGHDVRALNLKWLRAQIGLVSQEPVLFATSIRENILFGKPNATEAELVQAARGANVHDFISQLPSGYDTQVGEKGVQLSGGQKQRVAIARAIIKNPSIFLFDEATSALDASSERVVQDALDILSLGRTTLIIAHRLSTIQNCNSIAVVQGGIVVEVGSREELLMKGESGAFAALVHLQQMQPKEDGSSQRMSIKQAIACQSDDEAGAPELLEKQVNRVNHLWRGVQMSMPEWPYLMVGSVAAVLAGLVNPTFAFLVIQVLQIYFNQDKSYIKSQVSTYSIIFACFGAVLVLIFFAQHYCFGVCGERLVMRVRQKMFSAISSFEVGWFDREENTSSQVVTRLSSTARLVRAGVSDLLSTLLQNSTLLISGLIIAYVLEWRVALVISATLPLIIFSGIVEQMFMKGFAGNIAKTHERATKVAAEAVNNVRTVASLNGEERMVELVANELRGPIRSSRLRGHIAGASYGAGSFFLYASYALALWYGGLVVNKGQGEFQNVLKAFFILVMTSYGVAETIGLSPDMLRGLQALRSVLKLLDRKTKIDPNDEHGVEVESVKGEVEFDDVVFCYPARPQVTVLNHLSVRVHAGRSLALVGFSGSGKTSIIALLQRFYDPVSGAVKVDGTDIRRFKLRSYRQHVALVSQEPALFAASIYDNICYGAKCSVSESQVIEAAKLSGVHGFVSSLPQGYNTNVGAQGGQLSGGQKQRVAIARALVRQPGILLMDEATSALDGESEKLVQEALTSKTFTVVMVAHRLSTVWGADTIAVVDQGKIVEEGTHAKLLAIPNGFYSRLVNLQQD